jgi:hypothetical protein
VSGHVIPVSLSLSGEVTTSGTATLLERSMVARVVRAAVILGAMWIIAVICVFIPIAHFVLVPSFVAVGLVLAVVRLRDDVSLISAEGLCPRCQVQRTFGASGRFTADQTVHCDGCGCQIAVSRREPSP